ncbi:MAG: hypothetical protein U1F20_08705 [Lysobacterales bacterium]
MNRNDDAFDAGLRATWREAVDAVPPTLARRLRPVATEPRAPARWPLGAALAAAAVLASPSACVHIRRARRRPATTTATAIAAGGDGTLTAPLDRSPDFYAWLASPDAERLAME